MNYSKDKILLFLNEWQKILGGDFPIIKKDIIKKTTKKTSPNLNTLDSIAQKIKKCKKCKLSKFRKNPVPGEGNPKPVIVFVGEAPGREEDIQGRPFVGAAGELLTAMIEKGIKIPRKNVFITNIVKCRPPENRDPEEDEISACFPYLEKQISLLKPKVIICLGRIASKSMLKTMKPLNLLRGKVHNFNGIPLVATWHPSYLLRNPSEKKGAWEDLKIAMKIAGIPIRH